MATRLNVELLNQQTLAGIRDAYAKMMTLPDERGYGYFAGIHGLPLPISCRHSPRNVVDYLFLPWHRAYLYFFELALQDQSPDVGVPWWDWTSTRSHTLGLPEAFAATGAAPNPLNRAPFDWPQELIQQVTQALPDTLDLTTTPPSTRRNPEAPDELPRRQTVGAIMGSRTYAQFSTSMENLHGAVHVWVGGTMGQVPTAAYDPIFWSHHAFIDYLWQLWQTSPNGEPPPDNMMDVVLDPFPVRVRDMLDIGRLGYDYANAIVS